MDKIHGIPSRKMLERNLETYLYRFSQYPNREEFMPKEPRREGFHSAAGLIRYFESEDEKALKINPWFVVAMAVIAAFLIEIFRWQFPT